MTDWASLWRDSSARALSFAAATPAQILLGARSVIDRLLATGASLNEAREALDRAFCIDQGGMQITRGITPRHYLAGDEGAGK